MLQSRAEVVKQDLSGERPFWCHSTQRGAFFSCFLVRLMLYTVVIASLVLLQFPQFMAEKKVCSMKKVPQSVKVSLVAPVKPKPRPKPKQKPKKIIKPKPKPKKRLKAKPKPQPKPEAKTVPADINKTAPKKVQIQEREPIVERAVSIEEPSVPEALSMEQENKTENHKAYIENYKAYIRGAIRSEKKYPTKARRMRHQGSVKVRFVIDEHGKIIESEIVHSSGFNTLDKATLSLFKRIDSFDAPPEILETPYEFTIPLVYKLN